jgi:hypothetical protein
MKSNLILAFCFLVSTAFAQFPQTAVSIQGEKFYINGSRTYANGILDGQLPNSRMVQATFDDANPNTVTNWKYPDGSAYDPVRQTNEFVAALDSYKAKGLLAVTVNFQGGGPIQGQFGPNQMWDNTAFNADGTLKTAYLTRMDQVIKALDQRGMVCILGYFYLGQVGRLTTPDANTAVANAVTNATNWVLNQGYTNVMIEIANECDLSGFPTSLKPSNIGTLITAAKMQSITFGHPLLVAADTTSARLPSSGMVAAEDFILLHGNNLTASQLTSYVNSARALGTGKPIIFNEDSTTVANFKAAVNDQASWGYYDQGANDYVNGFQSPPTNWTINTTAKQNFFNTVVLVPSIMSRKTHGTAGTFDVLLPGVECRIGDPTLIFSFINTLSSVSGATLSTGTGSVVSSMIDPLNAHNYIVNLTGVSNAQWIAVTLNNVVDTTGASSSSVLYGRLGMLTGDTNGDTVVNSADISQVKGQSGQVVTNVNFREDLNVDGAINSADISLVKSSSGTALPP